MARMKECGEKSLVGASFCKSQGGTTFEISPRRCLFGIRRPLQSTNKQGHREFSHGRPGPLISFVRERQLPRREAPCARFTVLARTTRPPLTALRPVQG